MNEFELAILVAVMEALTEVSMDWITACEQAKIAIEMGDAETAALMANIMVECESKAQELSGLPLAEVRETLCQCRENVELLDAIISN